MSKCLEYNIMIYTYIYIYNNILYIPMIYQYNIHCSMMMKLISNISNNIIQYIK